MYMSTTLGVFGSCELGCFPIQSGLILIRESKT